MSDDTTDLSRRRFLGHAGGGLAALSFGGASALALAACGDAAQGPAYRYWKHKDKGSLDDLSYLAMCGTLAPSPHNTQPWRFRLLGDRIEVFADRRRHLGSADAQWRMLQLSIGCALENMRVAAPQLGYRAHVEGLDADRRFGVDGYCATLRLERAGVARPPWFDAIFARQTTRTAFQPEQPSAGLRQDLDAASSDLPGIGLRWLTLGPDTQRLVPLVKRSVRSYLTDQRHRDGMQWFRITQEEWQRKGDGIAIFNSDAPAYAKQYVEWFVDRKDVLGAEFRQGEIDSVDRVAGATPLWGLVHADRVSPNARVRAGQLAERVYLAATAHGYAVQPLCYPTEVADSARALAALAGLRVGAEPLFLFRVGRSSHVGHSVRRELKDVIFR